MFLLLTHGRSLNHKSLRTLLAETEAIVNSRPLTVDTLGDVQSEQPICPSNILTMKSKVVLPPPGHFVKADEYSRKRWGHIATGITNLWMTPEPTRATQNHPEPARATQSHLESARATQEPPRAN